MSTTSIVEMFYIGNFADMDTDELDYDNESPNIVLGTHSNLAITAVSEIDADDDGVIYDDETATGDYLSYDTGGGTISVNLDNSSLYNADILLGDGSTMSVPVLVIQAANGDVFISEYPPNPLDGLAIQSISLLSVNNSDAAGINAGASNVENASVVCYASGTLIDTPHGARLVETLKPGDFVMTRDHGAQAIRWIRSSDRIQDDARPGARPIQIDAGALGDGVPAQDLIVSPQHRILVGGAGQLEAVFNREAFAPAKSLIDLPGIRHLKEGRDITWIHFACDRHEVVTANGCLSESLLLGTMVLNGLTPEERRVLETLYGNGRVSETALNGPPALKCLTVTEARKRIARLRKTKGRAHLPLSPPSAPSPILSAAAVVVHNGQIHEAVQDGERLDRVRDR